MADQLLEPALCERFVPLQALDSDARRRLLSRARLLQRREGERVSVTAQSALFLLEGRIGLLDDSLQLQAGEALARHRLRAGTASIHCHGDCSFLAVDAFLLDLLLSLATDDAEVQAAQLSQALAGDTGDWKAILLSLPSFQKVAPMALQTMFLRMQALDAEPGETIVREQEPGDAFYVLVSGRCQVSQLRGLQTQVLAELRPGACFGEEALLGEQLRNASVTMLSRGRLMRLARQDFQELLQAPLEARIHPIEARERLAAGAARLLDVRSAEEFTLDGWPQARNLPLPQLREACAQLDAETEWIVCCDTGRRSSVAVFLLAQRGFAAVSLEGGLTALKAQGR